jgi:hypothetical protein
MIFCTPAILGSGVFTVPSTPFEVYAIWTLGISGASWSIAFSNNASPDINKTFTVSFGSGETTHRNLAYDSATMHVELSKLNNGGIAQDSGTINVYKNAGTLLGTFSFVVLDNVSSVTFDLVSLVPGDTVYVSFNES